MQGDAVAVQTHGFLVADWRDGQLSAEGELLALDLRRKRLPAPHVVLESPVDVDWTTPAGEARRGKTIEFEAGETIHVTMPPDGQSTTVRVNFTANDAGPRIFKVRIEPQQGEQVTQNNTRDALVEVWDRRERVL